MFGDGSVVVDVTGRPIPFGSMVTARRVHDGEWLDGGLLVGMSGRCPVVFTAEWSVWMVDPDAVTLEAWLP